MKINANLNHYSDTEHLENTTMANNNSTVMNNNNNKSFDAPLSATGSSRRPIPTDLPFSVRISNLCFRVVTAILRVIFTLVYSKSGKKMPAIKDPILLESATSLARKIRHQELSSIKVLNAFIERIKEVNPLLNCVVDERFEDARKEAEAADEFIRTTKLSAEELASQKPFLGVPFSTKNCIAVKGMLNTSGLYARRERRATEDAVVVARMREAGAIPFALTNVSEVCMWWESNNTLYGRTCNPYDTNRIVGGSSGGEGCIQAAAASPMGLGSDIGGSIRMPAFFNGVFGHKPTMGIVSNKGQFPMPLSAEQDSFLGTGPIVRYAEDLKPIMRVITDVSEKKGTTNNDDATSSSSVYQMRLKLNDEKIDLSQLRFYYQENDGGGRFVSPVDNDIRTGLQNVVNYLRQQFNAEVKRIQFPEFRQSAAMWFANMKDNSGYNFGHQLSNLKHEVNPYTELLKWLFGMSNHTLIGLLTVVLEKMQCQYGSKKYNHLVEKRGNLRKYMSSLLGDNGILLYPTHPTVAPYHNEPIFRPINFSYTGIVNILGFPSTAVPLGVLGSEGLPIGIQVIANAHQDHLCLAVAEELERSFGGWCRP